MSKGRYLYYPIIQNPEHPFKREFIYLNQREWTDPATGIYRAAQCLGLSPNGNHMYVVDTQHEHAGKMKAVMDKIVKDGVHPVIGPFDSVQEAVIEERKVRPMTDAERLVFAESEAERLRQENEELRNRNSGNKGK
jgi:hypothetical protein